jgi:hypothetical protein
MSNRNFADQISKGEVLLSGLKNNVEKLSRRGIDEVFNTQYETDLRAAIALNNEQEQLKAALKLKTAALEEKMLSVEKSSSEATKVVKMNIPKEQWVEFGITSSK